MLWLEEMDHKQKTEYSSNRVMDPYNKMGPIENPSALWDLIVASPENLIQPDLAPYSLNIT